MTLQAAAAAAADEAVAALDRRARGEVDAAGLVADLRASGLLRLCLAPGDGGAGLATEAVLAPALARVLRRIGAADLSAGRLFEGHVNAVKLVALYGSPEMRAGFAADIRDGAISGCWNAERPPGLAFDGARLTGEKIWCSGAGVIERPLTTGKDVEGRPVMVAPRSTEGRVTDVTGWRVHGMRATATGTVTFEGVPVAAGEVVGAPGDYYRAPWFRGGAWRFCAVQLGGIERIVQLTGAEIAGRGRAADAHQQARFADLLIAAETARLWVARACAVAEQPGHAPDAVDAYVNLCRIAVERAALAALQLSQRSLGLSAFLDDNPIEAVARDLATYLRQPFPDGAQTDAARWTLDRFAAHDPAPEPWA